MSINKPIMKIRNLQALRLYAAFSVVLYHTKFTIHGVRPLGGIFGVHLFFLMSGYIMASIIDNDSTAFVRRRLIRIIPLYWTLTLFLYAIAWKFPHLMGATRALPSDLIKSLLFVPFAKSNGLYQPILFVGWTVNYEMFFYMMLSIAVLINRRRAAILGAAIMLTVMAVCSLFADHSVVARFYSDPVALECVVGLFAYYCVRYTSPRMIPSMKPVLLVLFVAGLVMLPVVEVFNLFPNLPMDLRFGPLSFIVICSACLLAFSGIDIKVKAIVLLGDASYVMYLTHPYVEEFLDRVIGGISPTFHIQNLAGCLIAIAFVLPISVFLYVTVDRPSMRYLNRVLCGRRLAPSIPSAPTAFAWAGEATDEVVARPGPAIQESTLA